MKDHLNIPMHGNYFVSSSKKINLEVSSDEDRKHLIVTSLIPSLSSSPSQASPIESSSLSAWSRFTSLGQLSQTSPTKSRSVSVWSSLAWFGQLSQASPTVSPSSSAWFRLRSSGQLSQTSPTVSTSPSAWFRLESFGQLSTVSNTLSPSESSPAGQSMGQKFPCLYYAPYRIFCILQVSCENFQIWVLRAKIWAEI